MKYVLLDGSVMEILDTDTAVICTATKHSYRERNGHIIPIPGAYYDDHPINTFIKGITLARIGMPVHDTEGICLN